VDEPPTKPRTSAVGPPADPSQELSVEDLEAMTLQQRAEYYGDLVCRSLNYNALRDKEARERRAREAEGG